MKYIFWISIGIITLWLIKVLDIFNVILLFMIAGAIPGTNILLPPIVMMVVLSLMLLLVAYWLKRQQIAKQIRELKNTPAKSTSKKLKTKPTNAKSAKPKAKKATANQKRA